MTIGVNTGVTVTARNSDATAARTCLRANPIGGVDLVVGAKIDSSAGIAIRVSPEDDVAVVGSQGCVCSCAGTSLNVDPISGLECYATTLAGRHQIDTINHSYRLGRDSYVAGGCDVPRNSNVVSGGVYTCVVTKLETSSLDLELDFRVRIELTGERNN